MGVHDGHRDRKKAQYRRCGSEPFADHELLELLLFFAIPRVDTNPAAHALLDPVSLLGQMGYAHAKNIGGIAAYQGKVER